MLIQELDWVLKKVVGLPHNAHLHSKAHSGYSMQNMHFDT